MCRSVIRDSAVVLWGFESSEEMFGCSESSENVVSGLASSEDMAGCSESSMPEYAAIKRY